MEERKTIVESKFPPREDSPSRMGIYAKGDKVEFEYFGELAAYGIFDKSIYNAAIKQLNESDLCQIDGENCHMEISKDNEDGTLTINFSYKGTTQGVKLEDVCWNPSVMYAN